MTLLKLLEIKSVLVHRESLRSLDLAERMWIVRGKPKDEEELEDLLEAVLTRCVEMGIRYAPILLKRKKALERGAWHPRPAWHSTASPGFASAPVRTETVSSAAPTSPAATETKVRAISPAAAPASGRCSRCGGRGTYTEAGLNRLCPCGSFLAWAKSLAPVDPDNAAV